MIRHIQDIRRKKQSSIPDCDENVKLTASTIQAMMMEA
jgi:hypothetical protein